jgi:hypothetical protein
MQEVSGSIPLGSTIALRSIAFRHTSSASKTERAARFLPHPWPLGAHQTVTSFSSASLLKRAQAFSTRVKTYPFTAARV